MTKKIVFALAVILMNVKLVSAQTLSVGPMVGVNVSTIVDDPTSKYLPGLNLGGFLNYSIDSHWGLSAKLLYSQLGDKSKTVDNHTRLHYIQVPVTGVYYFGDPGNKFRPKLFAGLYAGALLQANNADGDIVIQPDGQKAYNNLDFGGLAGLGFNYRLKSRTWLNVDAGFNRGFADITKTTNTTYNNLAFNLNVGVSFPISEK